MNNLLDVNVSLYKTLKDIRGTETNLFQFLTNPIKRIDLDKLRLQYPDSEDFKKYAKPRIPAITPSGVFKPTRETSNLVKHTGLMVVDIDFKEQIIDMDIIYNRLKGLKYMAYLGKSCGGKGLFGIMPIAYTESHKSHFLSIEKELLSMDIVIDSSCKDIVRTRLYSYDSQAYFNLDAVPYTDLYVAPPKQYNYVVSSTLDLEDKRLQAMITDIQTNHINIAESYKDWFTTATILNNEFGEDGRELFHVISSQSRKYDESENDEMFDRVSNSRYADLTIGTLYYLYREAKKKIK